MSETSSQRSKPVIIIALIVACSLLGDSFLYVGLPLSYKTLGLNLVSVGILLSVNRIIRFISNSLASYTYNRYGVRTPLTIAIIIGTLVNLSYSLISGFLSFLTARVLWGVAWSFLRIPGYLFISMAPSEQRGKIMGIYQSISVVGSLFGTIVGGFLLDFIGFRSAALLLGCGSSIGIPLTILLRNIPLSYKSEEEPSIDIKLMFRDLKMIGIGLGTSMNNLLIGSLLTSTLSLHLLENYGKESITLIGISLGIASLSSLLVAVRRISRVFISPFIGTLSDLVGRYKIVLTLFVLGSVSMMSLGLAVDLKLVVIAVLLAFISSTALGVVLATEVSDLAAQDKNRFHIINSYINWVDVGSALGPLIAYILRLEISFKTIYLGASVILSVVTFLIHFTLKKRLEP